MRSSHWGTPLLPIACFNDLKQTIEQSLIGNWIIRIEYAADDESAFTGWRTWGKPMFAIRDTAPVVNAILACRASFPHHGIRMTAERLNPASRLVYWVHQPSKDEPRDGPALAAFEPARDAS
jgi:ribulose bisphosphate carboxylase small subunit